MPRRLILASQSPRRKELLSQLLPAFEIKPSDAEESSDASLGIEPLAELNAALKADWIANQEPDAVVLGSDTIVTIDDLALGKPKTREEAESMLIRLQARRHRVVTGVCLVHRESNAREQFSISTSVEFKSLDRAAIQHYLNLINPFDKAGGYAIQEYGDFIIKGIQGSYNNVVGLPTEALASRLEKWGYSIIGER